MNRSKKTSPKTQATTNGARPHIATTPERVEFIDLADNLAPALAAIIEHDDCPECLAARIEALHSGLVSEFNVEVAADIRLRFADACQVAADNRRPAD
jgi:hypothetical protein